MGDKEPRKRKKRKENNNKREETDDLPQPKEKPKLVDRPPSEESSRDVGHEPSIFAKSVFFILFSLLIVAVGVIFFTLHGVQRVPAETESLVQPPVDDPELLQSKVPDGLPMIDEQPQTSEDSDESDRSTAGDPQVEEEDFAREPQIDPSDMHPWAEHLPPEKPEEQNVFNQLYEALSEDFFRDEEQGDDHQDEEDEPKDLMDDSFFKVDDGETEASDLTGSETFEVIVEDVSIPPLHTLLDLPQSEVIDSSMTDEEQIAPTPPVESLAEVQTVTQSLEVGSEVGIDDLISQAAEEEDRGREGEKQDDSDAQGVQETKEVEDEDDNDDDDDFDDEDDISESELEPNLIEPSETYLPWWEQSQPEELLMSVEGAVPTQNSDQETSNIEGMEFIDWPENSPPDETIPKQEPENIEPAVPDNSNEQQQQFEFSEQQIVEEVELPQKESNPGEPFEVVQSADTDDNEPGDYVPSDYDTVERSEVAQDSAQDDVVIESENAQKFGEYEPPYEHADVTNEYDFLFKEDIDEADRIVEKSPESALTMFERLATKHPKSPRVVYGRARSLDKLAEIERKNQLLDQAIDAYKQVMTIPGVPKTLYLEAANRCVNRLRFRGNVGQALRLQSEMANKFPDNVDIQNQLGVSYLWVGKGMQAKVVFRNVLRIQPCNGFAKVHLGFILKTEDNKYEEAAALMREGIASREEGVIDGRFYFHLGDALSRLGKPKQAMLVYEEGVREGVFRSAYQRSLYNVDNLTGKPWWKPQETPYYAQMQSLEKNWIAIRNEALSLMDDSKTGFTPENEGLKDTGDWKQFELFSRGKKIANNCRRAPRTCSLVENIPDSSGCKRGQVKFSIMQAGTHVWAHTGPTNCRIRAHLGLIVPEGPRIRVANETRTWTEGKILIFDDSFEHEVWHNGSSLRLVLIADFWHPELTSNQKATLSPI